MSGFNGTAFKGLTEADVVNNLDSTSTDKPLSAAQGKELNDKIPKIISFNKTVTIPDDGNIDIYILNETAGNIPVGAFVKFGNNYPLPFFSGNYKTYVELLNSQNLRINNNVAGWGSQTVAITLYFA